MFGATKKGGAVYLERSRAIFRHCIFEADSAGCCGGAVASLFSEPLIYLCTFSGNFAGSEPGGALAAAGTSVLIQRSTFYGNAAACGQGGGIYVHGASDASVQNTIVANSTDAEGVYCSENSQATLECCDVFGNAGGDWVGCIAGQESSSGNMHVDPQFCDPANGDFRLESDSPCLPYAVGTCGLIGAWGSCLAAVKEELLGMNDGLRLVYCSPNPFGHHVTVTYVIRSTLRISAVCATVYDACGRIVAELLDDLPQGAGSHDIIWQGVDREQRPVGTGVYFMEIRAGRACVREQLVVLR